MILPKRVAMAAVFLLSLAVFAAAQESRKEERLRTVSGVVSDKQDNYIPGSVVFLKNTRTQAVQSRITGEDGGYRFTGLDPNTDYEIHAEKDGAKSSTRTVSSFDTRKEIVLNFKIDRKRS
jgi:hypothetical protein